VRDNIHSLDVARFMAAFVAAPRAGEVYNLGGGKANSTSILEAFKITEKFTGKPRSTPTSTRTAPATTSATTATSAKCAPTIRRIDL
jgi:nucleoside-diphosphate-sugar epimerase